LDKLKHTPGPWKVIDRGAPHDPEMKIINPNLARFWIASMKCGHAHGEVAPIASECSITCAPHLDSEGNAYLMAAAPELLRECQFALEMLKAETRSDVLASAGYRNFLHRLTEVIAKATTTGGGQ